MASITTQVGWEFTAECPENSTTAVDIWQMDSYALPAAESIEMLSASEQQHSLKISDAKARQWYLQHRLFRRQVLSRYLGCLPADIEFATQAEGKPYLASNPKLHFNLSHTRGQCLLAVSPENAVGIDVEPVRSVKNWQAISQRVFPHDWLEAQTGVLNEENFIQTWTLFEARQKCTGSGVFGTAPDQPQSCHSFAPEAGFTASVCIMSSAAPGWRFFRLAKDEKKPDT